MRDYQDRAIFEQDVSAQIEFEARSLIGALDAGTRNIDVKLAIVRVINLVFAIVYAAFLVFWMLG